MLLKKYLMYLCKSVSWHYLCSLRTMLRVFVLYRQIPINRFYIEDFLYKNRSFIKGNVFEVAENSYSKKFSSNVTKFEIFYYTNNKKNAIVIKDLQILSTIRAFKDVFMREMSRLKYAEIYLFSTAFCKAFQLMS